MLQEVGIEYVLVTLLMKVDLFTLPTYFPTGAVY